ncbi:unnamed protein product [Callosobruchus maculatus]|uniref:Uncharacterized protein n=1 Tax=Callosobruchus maculatus TaxID=64391 RepID=A0A653CAG1_CALMS|nr:unnamed protein product [Callosobruchus maculatus]
MMEVEHEELKGRRHAEKIGAGAEDVEHLLLGFKEIRFLQPQEYPTPSISTINVSQDIVNLSNKDCACYLRNIFP